MIIDAHHHIWRLADVHWLQGPIQPRIFGDYRPLQRDYPIEEFVADIAAANVVKSVYVQCNWPIESSVDEVAWVQSVADRHGFPHGIVGFADLSAPDVAATLDRMLQYRNLRGVRQQLHWHEKVLYRYASRPDWMNDPQWRAGLAQVQKRGLLFELQVFTSQFDDCVKLVRDFPGTTFVLMHAGMLEDRSPEGLQAWRGGMQRLAAQPNVLTKLSGLGTFEHECSERFWTPVIQETLDIFGPQRCIFGSNLPIEKLWTTYADIIRVTESSLAGLSPGERRAVMHDNAARVYRLN